MRKAILVVAFWFACPLIGIYGKEPAAQIIDPDNFQVGESGTFPTGGKFGYSFKVIQILDGKNMLVQAPGSPGMSSPFGGERVGESPGRVFWVKDYQTAGITDGASVNLPGIFKVEGTKQYRTAKGGSKTVFLVRPENGDERKARLAAETAARETEIKKREAAGREYAEKRRKAEQKEARAAARREAQRPERQARLLLRLGNGFRDEAKDAIGQKRIDLLEKAKGYYKSLVKKYPKSNAAVEAKKALEEFEN